MAVITTDQLDLLRTAHYEGSAYLIAGPQNVVFAARVNGNPAGNDYAQIAYDTVTVGDYEDIMIDMDVRISRTSDIRDAFFYGRIRKSPTSSILYINETSAAINDDNYIWVLNNYPLVIRQRYKTFVDWDKSHTPPPPLESNVDSAYVACTTAATAQFSLSSMGQAIAKGATITSVEWSIPDVTYIDGDEESEDIVIEVESPYNEWGHLTLTDSNGTPNTLHFTITAGDPNTASFFRLCHEDVPVSSDWENGFSASTSYWGGIDDLLDRTRITLVSVETFDGEELGVGNVQFVGYLDTAASNTAGDETHGQSKEAQIEFSGLMQLAGKLRFNPIAIRHSAAPAAWDFINTPTPVRNIVHLFAQHSTFLNLCSLDFQGLNETFLTGNVNVEERSLTDAARKVTREINGYLIQSPAGKVTLVRDPRVGSMSYRASIPDKTPDPIDLGDVYSYKLTREGYDKVGWMDVGFMVVHPTNFTPTFITANAPASGPGDGQEDSANPSQLLAATSNMSNALAEARQRTGDLYELANARRKLEVNFGSGWGGVVRAMPGEYYQFIISDEDDVRGYGISPDDDWLCLSVNMTINRNGTQDTIGTFVEVTQGGNALIAATISPSAVTTPIPVLPVFSPYPAMPMPASINYDSLTPENPIAGDPFSGMQTLPLSTEDAAKAAQNQPKSGESRAFTYFSYDGNVTMDFTTVLGEDYALVVSGSALIGDTGIEIDRDFLVTDGAPEVTGDFGEVGFTSAQTNGTGYQGTGTDADRNYQQYDFASPTYVESVMFLIGAVGDYTAARWRIGSSADGDTFGPVMTLNPGQTSASRAINDTVDFVRWGIERAGGDTSAVGPIIGVIIILSGGVPLYADALYQYEKDADGKPINVAAHSGRGLYINNAAIGGTLPPFNENGIYNLSLGDFNGGLGGDGNPISFKFNDDNYSDNERLALNLVVKGPGAGT